VVYDPPTLYIHTVGGNLAITMNELEFQFRDKELTEAEKYILEATGITENYFRQLFSNVIISELVTNSIKVSRYDRTPIEGLVFSGKRISIVAFSTLKAELNKRDLNIEVSWDVLTPRYYDFKFPHYSNRDVVVDIDKQYYKIYPKRITPDFVSQVDFINGDKSNIETAYNEWRKHYNIEIIWMDRTENLLFVNTPTSQDTIDNIFEAKRRIYWDIDRNIEMGWSTIESIKEDIRNRLPFLDLCFYNK
jgi:hypothetical protein